jgi:hypothetical protein
VAVSDTDLVQSALRAEPMDHGSDAPNNQRCAQRLLPDARAHEFIGEGDVGRLLVLCKARQVIGHPDAVVHAPRDLDEIRLERRLAEIALASFGDERLIVLEGPVQLAQLLDAELERTRLVREKGGTDSRARGRDVVNRRVLKGWEFGHFVCSVCGVNGVEVPASNKKWTIQT